MNGESYYVKSGYDDGDLKKNTNPERIIGLAFQGRKGTGIGFRSQPYVNLSLRPGIEYFRMSLVWRKRI